MSGEGKPMPDKMERFNALITPEQDDIMHYFSVEYGTGRCQILRDIIDSSKKVLVVRRRLLEDPEFRTHFRRQVIKGRGE